MKVLSLFDGIGGARQALKDLNIDCDYYASEIDKYAIQVAKANHSDIKHIGDIKLVNKGFNEFDLLIGGSPCQDLSIAKKDRKGLRGDRSSLFYEYLRILNETKPKYFILENVASMSKESQEIITKELFDIEPVMINSALLTAQNRKRLYWVGKLVDGEYKQVNIDQPRDKEIYLKDIIEENVDEKYYIKDHVSELTFAYINNSRVIKKSEKAGTLTATYYKGIRGAGRPMIVKKDVVGKHLDNVKKSDYNQLTPTECCRLQGFPDDYVSMVSNTQGYKGLGNSFTVPVIKHILQKILKF